MPNMSIAGVDVLPRISDYVDHFAAETPQAEAIVCRGQRIDYRNLADDIDAWARALLAAGIGKGDRVAMLSTPRAEFWAAFLATTRIGAIWVGLNPRYSLRECEYVMGDAEPALLIMLAESGGDTFQSHLDGLIADRSDLPVVAFGGTLEHAVALDEFLADGERVTDEELTAAMERVDTRDPCLIVYTSGSTGSPKGAVLTHYGLTYGATMQTTHFRLEDPSLVVCFPVNHVGCIADTCATTLVKGGKIVFQEQFDPEATVRATLDEHCTMMGGIPTMFQLQMETAAFKASDFPDLRMFLWGGAAMPKEMIETLQALGKRLVTAYGMTETACHVTYTDADADTGTLAATVGRPDPNCGIRVATEDGHPSAADNPGELQVHGEFLMLGYWHRPDATRETFTEDGWLKTGDIAYEREDGNIRLVGRMSDMFKSGGYNVYPREIETVLEQHPAVAIAAIVSIPDPLYQEVGVAYIKRDADVTTDAEALDRWCRDRLANYKVPKAINILDELPLLPIGKVDKQALKRRARGD